MAETPKPEQILAARQSLNLTQTEAAGICNVSLRTWAYWESGEVQQLTKASRAALVRFVNKARRTES